MNIILSASTAQRWPTRCQDTKKQFGYKWCRGKIRVIMLYANEPSLTVSFTILLYHFYVVYTHCFTNGSESKLVWPSQNKVNAEARALLKLKFRKYLRFLRAYNRLPTNEEKLLTWALCSHGCPRFYPPTPSTHLSVSGGGVGVRPVITPFMPP